jgi:hypothetical protein
MREQWQRLLGGFATRTLSPGEERALLEASLDDQELFDALAREQALRDLLDDSSARAHLLQVLEPRVPWPRRAWNWLWGPAGLAVTAAAAAGVVAAVFLVHHQKPAVQKPAMVAEVRQAPAAPPEAGRPREAEPVKTVPTPVKRKQAGGGAGRGPGGPPPEADKPAPQQKLAGGVVGGILNAPTTAPAAAPAPAGAAPAAPFPPPPTRVAPPAPAAPGAAAPSPSGAAAAAAAAEQKEKSRMERFAAFDSAADARRDNQVLPLRGRPMAAKRAASESAPAPAIRWTILAQNPEGDFVPAAPGSILAPDARVRLRFEPGEPGYLYVLQRENSGGWQLLAAEPLRSLAPFEIPRTGALLHDEAGPKRVFVVFTREPQPALARLDPEELERRFGPQAAPQPGDLGITLRYR